jgi:hypothetical protein
MIRVSLSTTGMILAIVCTRSPFLAFLPVQFAGWSSFVGCGPFAFPRGESVTPFSGKMFIQCPKVLFPTKQRI